jgi:hypothetical protein
MRHVIDELYDAMGEESSVASQIRIGAHLFFCRACRLEARKLEMAEEVMGDFPRSPAFEDCLMEKIERLPLEGTQNGADASFRGWIITGLIVLLSLSTLFFGMDFEKVARSQGPSFLIPIGITIGGVLSGYGALFIVSHLEELSKHFGLR